MIEYHRILFINSSVFQPLIRTPLLFTTNTYIHLLWFSKFTENYCATVIFRLKLHSKKYHSTLLIFHKMFKNVEVDVPLLPM